MHPLQFLEKHFGRHTNVKKEALFHCPFCKHHKPKLSVNLSNFFWKCWVCDTKGRTLFSLVWKTGNQQVINDYKIAFPRSFVGTEEQSDEDFVLKFPEEYMPLCHHMHTFDGKRAVRYLKQRHVSEEQIIKHKIGFATEGRFVNRLILPSFNAEGYVNFYTGRTFVNDAYKYLNPPMPVGYKNTIVMNELNIDWRKPVYLVEGFMDMLRVGDNAIPLFGSTLPESSKTFIEMVLNDAKVYVCLDIDARKKQLAILESLSSYGLQGYDLKVNPYKDIGNMHRAKILERQGAALLMDRASVLRERIRDA